MNPKKVSFRIRKQYYDKILSGEKTEELRQLKQFWIDRLFCNDPPQEAVFVCGTHVHRRKIEAIYYCIPEEMLGRELSDHGKQDIQSEICICIELSYAVCERCCDKVLTVYPYCYNDEYDCGEPKEMNVCWGCDHELMNGRGEPNDDPWDIEQDRAVEAYENDPINEPYPYPI